MSKFEQFSSEEVKKKWEGQPGDKKVEVGRFTDKGVELTPMSEEERRKLEEASKKNFVIDARSSEMIAKIEQEKPMLESRVNEIKERSIRLFESTGNMESAIRQAVDEVLGFEDEE